MWVVSTGWFFVIWVYFGALVVFVMGINTGDGFNPGTGSGISDWRTWLGVVIALMGYWAQRRVQSLRYY
jgi:hypothetical protein